VSSIVLRTPLERKGLLPLHEQLRSALEMAIIAGEIPDGAALPSVRQLAETLDVSCSTVVRVYRDLRDAQLIRSSPKRGYFVTAGVTPDEDRPAAGGVKQLVEEAINGALAAGLDLPSFLQLVVEQVRQRQRTVRGLVAGHATSPGVRRRLADRHGCGLPAAERANEQ
jgi:GntR family transcriptional regulator